MREGFDIGDIRVRVGDDGVTRVVICPSHSPELVVFPEGSSVVPYPQPASEQPKRLIPYTDPADIHMVESGIPGYHIPVVNAVLRLRPESTVQKHDGKLDDCEDAKVQHGAMYPGEVGIYIRSTDDMIYLDPSQALSLLIWLEQERSTLEQLAKEQEG
jgi:hypothetical protein